MSPREIVMDRHAVHRENALCERAERFCLRRIVFDEEGMERDIICGELAKEFFDQCQSVVACKERRSRFKVHDIFFETFLV